MLNTDKIKYGKDDSVSFGAAASLYGAAAWAAINKEAATFTTLPKNNWRIPDA